MIWTTSALVTPPSPTPVPVDTTVLPGPVHNPGAFYDGAAAVVNPSKVTPVDLKKSRETTVADTRFYLISD